MQDLLAASGASLNIEPEKLLQKVGIRVVYENEQPMEAKHKNKHLYKLARRNMSSCS